MMKNFILFIITITATVTHLAAQNPDDASLKKDWDSYYGLITSEKLEEAMDYVNPLLFKVVPKESMIEMLNGVYNNETMDISFGKNDITLIEKPLILRDTIYKKFTYLSEMQISVKQQAINDSENIDLVCVMKAGFKASFGKENVILEEENTFLINASKIGMAMYDPKSTKWFFITIEKGQDMLYNMIFNDDVATYILNTN